MRSIAPETVEKLANHATDRIWAVVIVRCQPADEVRLLEPVANSSA